MSLVTTGLFTWLACLSLSSPSGRRLRALLWWIMVMILRSRPRRFGRCFRQRVLRLGAISAAGGGVAFDLREVLGDASVSHVSILDDDGVVALGALEAKVAALQLSGADAAVPLVTNAAGNVHCFPGPLVEPTWREIRRRLTPQEFRTRCGCLPLRWSWASWSFLLVTRQAIETVGLPWDDYWFQGEDLEWTLRISARFSCVLAPAAECAHRPPDFTNDESRRAARHRLKSLAMLQNNTFTASRLPHVKF